MGVGCVDSQPEEGAFVAQHIPKLARVEAGHAPLAGGRARVLGVDVNVFIRADAELLMDHQGNTLLALRTVRSRVKGSAATPHLATLQEIRGGDGVIDTRADDAAGAGLRGNEGGHPGTVGTGFDDPLHVDPGSGKGGVA